MSETRVMTLTDFLLARIAEDESAAQRAGSFTPWGETFQNDNYGHLTIQPSRVLAECEAKRRIVEDRLLYDFMTGKHVSAAGQRILLALASVYADHPDFRDEWRA